VADGEVPDIKSIAITYEASSVSPMRIARDVAGQWRLIWLIDRAKSDPGTGVRLLAKLGPVVDVTGLDSAAAAVALRPFEPSGILAFAETDLLAASQIAHELGLCFYSPDTAKRLINKRAQREALAAAGIPVPRFWSIPRQHDRSWRDEVAGAVQYPAVLKPQAGSGSRNTFRVADAATLAALIDDEDSDLLGDDGWIVEEYLRDGVPRQEQVYADYVSVESVVTQGQFSHVAVTGRLPLSEPFRESGFFIPSNLGGELLTEVVELAELAAKALGVDVGCLHTEIKLTVDGPRVIEVNGRLGGGIPEMLELASGVSLFNIAARVALGEQFNLSRLPCDKVAYLFYMQAPYEAVTLNRLEGLDRVRALPGVDTIFLNRQPGDGVDWRDGNHGYLYSVLGVAEDHDAMRGLHHTIGDIVDVDFS
jgi:biotin carboxylase